MRETRLILKLILVILICVACNDSSKQQHKLPHISLQNETYIDSLNNCANNKMLSIIPSINGSYNDIKNKLQNVSIININNSKELPNIIDYIKNKGYEIVPLSNIIKE